LAQHWFLTTPLRVVVVAVVAGSEAVAVVAFAVVRSMPAAGAAYYNGYYNNYDNSGCYYNPNYGQYVCKNRYQHQQQY